MKSFLFLLIVEIYLVIAIFASNVEHLATSRKMVLCYNAGANGYGSIFFPYKCALVPRGQGY